MPFSVIEKGTDTGCNFSTCVCLNYFPVNGYLDCFQFGTIVNKNDIFLFKSFCEIYYHFSWVYIQFYLLSRIDIISVCLVVYETTIYFSKLVVTFYSHSNNV